MAKDDGKRETYERMYGASIKDLVGAYRVSLNHVDHEAALMVTQNTVRRNTLAKIKGTLQKETTHISTKTGTQFWDNGTTVRRWAETTETWTSTAANMEYEHFIAVGTVASIDYAEVELRMMALGEEGTLNTYTAVPKTTNKHNDKEDTMSTYTAKSLEEKINPTPVVDHSPARDVRALERANENAAAEIITIAGAIKHNTDVLSTHMGSHGVRVPEKYKARLQRILTDMRKDQEAILNETAAKLAKVTKAIS